MPFTLVTAVISRILNSKAQNEMCLRREVLVTDIQFQQVLDGSYALRRMFLFQRLMKLYPIAIRRGFLRQRFDSGLGFDNGERLP
jgi:hypothetical protein